MKELFEQISKLKNEYDKLRENNRFNVITALHKERDEVNLHSRIISYLLSPTSGHGMNGIYLKLFVREILGLDDKQFDLTNVIVVPNETEKSEYKEIDILIVNKRTSQAIIIENKIDAKDSNHPTNRDGYQGQLERYYNTIKTGKDKDKKPCIEYQSNNVFVYYLSMNGKPDKDNIEISIGMLNDDEHGSWDDSHILSYDSHIREWLAKCIESITDEKLQVKNFIQHYLNVINKLTNNDMTVEERLELKHIVAENIVETRHLIENFKHVKWHTVHEFWTELKSKLESENQLKNVSFYIDREDYSFEKAIDEVTHHNKDINHGLLFDIGDKKAYISGLGKLSWGIMHPKKWTNFMNEKIEDINFSVFSSESTYNLIDKTKMTDAVKYIIDEIIESINSDFQTLKQNTD